MEFQSPMITPIGRRIHFVEFHETTACPHFLREAVQDILATSWEFEDGIFAKRSPAKQVAGDLAQIVETTGITTFLDVCSGGGGPVGVIANTEAMRKCTFTLSDLHPNLGSFKRISDASEGRVKFSAQPVDATACNFGDGTHKFVRTMFASMHHMPSNLLERILRDCVEKDDVFVAFEATNRSPLPILMVIFGAMIVSALGVVKAFQQHGAYVGLIRFAFTFFIPFIPLIMVADGITSCLRTYSRAEFMEVAKRADPSGKYQWIVSERFIEGAPVPLTSYLGMPRKTGT